MHLVTDPQEQLSVAGVNVAEVSAVNQSAYREYWNMRRNGAGVRFDLGKISVVMTKEFLAIEGALCRGFATFIRWASSGEMHA